jgi:hypothetical protein
MSRPKLKAPFPYFGGKSSIAPLVWERFGTVANYVEPFMGSLAMLLCRPAPVTGIETVNDKDGFLANFWRAVRQDPEAVARYADWPVNENDLHARHSWLLGERESITARLEGDPEYFDAKVAGYWVWGASCWIGNGWCAGDGPWQVVEADDGARQLVKSTAGGVRRKRVGLGRGIGVFRQLVKLDGNTGVCRQRMNLGDNGIGVHSSTSGRLLDWFEALACRLRFVRVCCGDWSRVCGYVPTVKLGTTAVFLDPPYADTAGRDARLYRTDSESVAHDVREWCLDRGNDPDMRICLCGYDGEHVMPDSWDCVEWKANGGYGNFSKQHDNPNARRERLWFSPHCLDPAELRYPLFSGLED